MELFIVGIVSAVNLIVLKLKFDAKRYLDAMLDLTLYILLVRFSGDTLGGLVIATTGSLLVSIFLYFSPPKFGMKGD